MKVADTQTDAATHSPQANAQPDSQAGAQGEASFACDFCGATVPRVRRVALDGEYERLRTPHPVRYACPDCSARKDGERATGD